MPVSLKKRCEVVGPGEARAFAVVAAAAGRDEVVHAIVAAVAPGHEVIDLAAARDAGVAVKADAVLEVEQSFGDALKRDAVAAEHEVLELQHRSGILNAWVELGCLLCPPACDERGRSGPSAVNPSPTPGKSVITRVPARYRRTDQPPALPSPRRTRTGTAQTAVGVGESAIARAFLDAVDEPRPRGAAANHLRESPSGRSVLAA